MMIDKEEYRQYLRSIGVGDDDDATIDPEIADEIFWNEKLAAALEVGRAKHEHKMRLQRERYQARPFKRTQDKRRCFMRKGNRLVEVNWSDLKGWLF